MEGPWEDEVASIGSVPHCDHACRQPDTGVATDYDALGRLTALKDGITGTVIDGYSYDATGNRLSAKVGGAMQTYTYPTINHRLSAVAGVVRTYDKMGSTPTIGARHASTCTTPAAV